ncbi:MAG: hypothetical protein QOF40_658 [Actinomycetota bacterium]|jgi:hypothetical protein|nr:hypothetical protein [Actinomycetota bacterium]
MRPTVTEQLEGIRHILGDVVAPEVDDPYPAAVLAGALATLEVLAGAWAVVPAFLRWDAGATAAVLALVGVPVPSRPDDVLDIAALQAHHRDVRRTLEQSMPAVLADADARRAVVELFRDRAARFPMKPRPPGEPGAHPAR